MLKAGETYSSLSEFLFDETHSSVMIANVVSCKRVQLRVFFIFLLFKEGDVTKAEIANIIYERIGLSKKESAQIVETVLNEMKQALEAGEDVKLSGFGHFMIREKHARRGRNPKTGEDITIEPRRVVTFRPSQLLKEKLLEGGE